MNSYLIWSNQHGMWWRAHRRGYTQHIEEAGRYTRAEADAIVHDATVGGQLSIERTDPVTGREYRQFTEVIVLAPEAELLTILDETRVRMRDAEAAARQHAAELDAIGGMHIVEHEGHRLRVITAALHDRLCKARVATPQGTTPEVLHCASCGFCYPPVRGTSEQKGPNSRGNL